MSSVFRPGPFRASRQWPLLLIVSAVAVGLLLSMDNLSAILPPSLWWQIGLREHRQDISHIMLYDGWLPRLAISGLCGAVLGLAGTLFQQVLKNPLAEPMTLGVSAGAQLALTVITLLAPGVMLYHPQWAALGGALAAALIVLGLSRSRQYEPSAVSVAGLVVTLFCGSIIMALQLLYTPYLHSLFIWGGGSLLQQDWHNVAALGLQLVAGLCFALLLRRPLTVLAVGDTHAGSLGLGSSTIRFTGFTLAVVLSAGVVSAVGVIGFVGLSAPALARLAGARRFTQRLIIAPLCGALVLWLTDQTVQRLSGLLGDLPTGAATALFGAPLMLLLLARFQPTASPGERPYAVTSLHRPEYTAIYRRFAAIVVLLALVLALSLDFGRTPSGWQFTAFDALSRVAIWRGPRAVAAMSAGTMLAVAGVMIQRLTGNGLASPELLGVSAGAALGLVALLLYQGDASPMARLSVSTLGALSALLAILSFARRTRFSPQRILLAGIAVSALFQAIVAVVVAGGGDRAAALISWLAGSTYSIGPAEARNALLLCLLLCLVTPCCRRWLSLLPLGEETSNALGLATPRVRLALLGLIALLSAAATLIVGPVSFIGLTAPHFARFLGARRPAHQVLLAAPLGALMLVAADWLGRTLLMPRELPAGLVATLLGSPYLMWLLMRRR
ncbi:Fe(3+)-hydroxamate ABC transporter permease FhuB [Sodalis sp. dw_96]|uniref:Fe(3+)-hydroxamate ABC transporter permease FhuB n=1 Tax=Sodalis sp. dw_96 TaxID=2719794 RepID=UPI001BD2EBC5|nr:Fe(3+)-hydroxamate ABC transporter permease FhuB [Sodalis sp. dw_96]